MRRLGVCTYVQDWQNDAKVVHRNSRVAGSRHTETVPITVQRLFKPGRGWYWLGQHSVRPLTQAEFGTA
jgi:hypothetical protein